ncbi:alpha- and gamma-adaptin-binding protein p34-like [Discoglossus pictus]
MATIPSVVLTSCAAGFDEKQLVKLCAEIIGKEQSPAPLLGSDGVQKYPWSIDNKYFFANVNICIVPSTSQVTAQIAETVDAFLVYFDTTEKSGLEKVSEWLPLLEDWLPDVMILLCDRASETGVSRQTAQEWCIQHDFELVELNPEELPDEDDDFTKSTGVARIVQVLNANMWSNLEMKEEQIFRTYSWLREVINGAETSEDLQDEVSPPSKEAAENAGEQGRDGVSESLSDTQVDTIVDPMLDLDINELANLTPVYEDLESFFQVLDKLQEIKEKFASLPHEQRKLHAKKVAKAFCMAIGGDRDEVDGLFSEEES